MWVNTCSLLFSFSPSRPLNSYVLLISEVKVENQSEARCCLRRAYSGDGKAVGLLFGVSNQVDLSGLLWGSLGAVLKLWLRGDKGK